MKKILSLILIALMLFSLSACEGAESGTGEASRTITVGLDMTNLNTLDIFESDYNVVLQTVDAVFDRLLDKNRDTMELEPNLLAEMPTMSEDGLTYTFKMREDIVWSDGTPLTAKDVEFTFNYFYAKDTASENTWVGEAILGCLEMEQGEADKLEGFELIDDYNFKITLYKPDSAFLSTLATSYFAILPAHLRPEAGDEWGHTYLPVGSGPFKYTYFDAGVKCEMVPNENYHGTKPDCDKLVLLNMDASTALMEFEAGHIDFCALSADQIEDARNRLGKNLQENLVVGGIRINVNNGMAPLDDIRVRKALALSVDVDAIVDGYYKGSVVRLNGVLPKGIPGFDPDLEAIPYDPEQAKALLAEAGYPDGIDLEMSVRDSDYDYINVCQLMQEQMAASGIRMSIIRMDTSAFNDKLNSGNCQLAMRGIYADYMNAYMYHYNFGTEYSFNRSIALSDPKVDELLQQEVLLIGDENAKVSAELDKYLCKELYAVVPLFQAKKYYLVSDRVTNLFIKADNLYNFAEIAVVG